MTHTCFATSTRGLNRGLPPMRMYEKAKKLGNGRLLEKMVFEFGSWATVMDLTHQQDVIFNRLYRDGVKQIIREFPGGGVESHESLLEQVIRTARAGKPPQAMQVSALFLGLVQLGRIG